MARIRIGPLSYGPKGRRGVHAGPFSASYNTRSPAFGAFMLVVIVLAIIIKFWPVLVVGGLVFLVVWLATKEKRAEQAAARARARAEAQQRWLQAPPPTLYVPARFSEQWFAKNVPRLHPGQVPTLFAELKARGWTQQKIAQRLGRYLAQNPFLPRG
jgi:hypothetical protein